MDIEGLRKYAEFKVIDIVDDTNPYHALLGIDWEIENQTIIKFKKRILSFEGSEIRVVVPIDPIDGNWYLEPVHNEGKENYMDHLYKIMYSKEGYINPTYDGKLSRRSVSSFTSDSDEALENWQNRLHEVSMRRCVRTKKKIEE